MMKKIFISVFTFVLILSLSLIAGATYEEYVIPQLSFIEFIEENDETKALVEFDEEELTLVIGDEIRDRKIVDFEGNKIIFETPLGNQISLRKGQSFARTFVQTGVDRRTQVEDEEDPGPENGLEDDFDYTGLDHGNIGPVTVEEPFELKYKTTEAEQMEDAVFQIYYETDGVLAGVAANTITPTEGSYYISEPGEYVFEINTAGGVEWGINIIEQ